MHLSPPLLALLVVLATARGTILLVDDEITAPWRSWVVKHRPDNGPDEPSDKLVYLAHCPWCVSVWIGGGLAALTYWFGDTWPVVLLLLTLTASLATGFAAQAKDRI